LKSGFGRFFRGVSNKFWNVLLQKATQVWKNKVFMKGVTGLKDNWECSKGSCTPEQGARIGECNLVDGSNGISTLRMMEKCAPWSNGLKIHVNPFTWQIMCLLIYLRTFVERHTHITIFQGSLPVLKNCTKIHIPSS
jgi:hypothetical protein